MIFTTKGNNFSIFGKSIDNIKTKFYELFDVFEQYGLRGDNGLLSSLFSGKNEITPLTPELELEFSDFAEEFNSTSKSAQVVAEELGITNQAVVDYAKTQKNGTLTLEGFTNSLNKCSLASRAGQAALKGLAIAGNMLAAWAVAAAINAVVTGIDNLIHAEQKAKDRMAA